jgi:hypothetical protein
VTVKIGSKDAEITHDVVTPDKAVCHGIAGEGRVTNHYPCIVDEDPVARGGAERIRMHVDERSPPRC